jgi:hypothetical protein
MAGMFMVGLLEARLKSDHPLVSGGADPDLDLTVDDMYVKKSYMPPSANR